MAGLSTEQDRFRSFAERYLVARAGTLGTGDQRALAWEIILEARTLYKQIEMVSNEFAPKPEAAAGLAFPASQMIQNANQELKNLYHTMALERDEEQRSRLRELYDAMQAGVLKHGAKSRPK